MQGGDCFWKPMPGIAGVIQKSVGPEVQAAIRTMAECMRHEPFHKAGTYFNESEGVALGWVTDSGTFADCLPIWNERRDVVLIFAGEHFGEHESEIGALRAKGHAAGKSDASYLIHVYEERSIEAFLRSLNGWFSGVLIDFRERRVTVFNDRYGLKRVYYHETSDAFWFASEAKALLRVVPQLRQFDATSLGEYFACGCALQNRTLFAGVRQMPGGSMWSFERGVNVGKASYFTPGEWENQEPLGSEDYYERLRETFFRILPRYYAGAGEVGVSLTGGVDSRMVMAWSSGGRHPTYTFGGMYRDCGDVKLARQVAKICGRQHQVIEVGNDFLREFPRLAARTIYLSDGAMDVSGSPDLFVNRHARQIAPVRMTGNYGGEILRSLVAFKPMPVDQALFSAEFRSHVVRAAQTYAQELSPRRLSFVAFKQVPWHHYSRLSLESSQLTLRSPYLDNELVALAFRVPAEQAFRNEMSLRLIADGNRALAEIGTDRGLLLRSTPIVSKMQNLFQEFTFRAEYAYDYGMPNWLARVDGTLKMLHLERLFLGRHKFYHFRLWYRDALAPFLKEVLLDPRTLSRSYVDRKRLERAVLDHASAKRNHTLDLHKWLSVELMQRELLERAS